jgi:hypothetical protein
MPAPHSATTTPLDVTDLAILDDDVVERRIVLRIAACLRAAADFDEYLASVRPGARALYATKLLEDEVLNGGFSQYFWNTRANSIDDAIDGFDFLELPEHAALAEEALSIFDGEAERFFELRRRGDIAAYADFDRETKLKSIDARFFALKVDIGAVRIARLRKEPALFVVD